MRNGSIVQSGSSPNYVVAAADIGQTLTSEVFACDADECVPATSSNSIGPVDRPPSTPSSLSPANGSKLSSTPTLSSVFSDPDTGQTGHVSYSLYDDWTASLIGTGSGPTVSSGSASAWTPATLAAGDRYDWYAQAVDASGETSASTSEQQFDLPPTVPTLKSPANSATLTNATPVLSASATSKTPIYFDFQVATDSGFANVVADSGWIPTTNTWTVLPGLLNDGSTYYWRAAAADAYGVSSAWSSGQSFSIRLPKLGARDYWPMWSHGPVEVNEANGNLVLAAPGPSYPTSAGSMGASLTYNAQSSTDNGFGAGWALNVGDPGSSPPTELIDHNASGAPSPHLDAVERISADGSSDFYTHVGSSNTYLSAPGDGSELTKNPDGTWTLDDPDGAIYTFNPENSSGVATLKSAEWVDASP